MNKLVIKEVKTKKKCQHSKGCDNQANDILKLKGEGQTTCHKCKQINWTCFGFYHYKGQTLCDKCLKEILAKESINGITKGIR